MSYTTVRTNANVLIFRLYIILIQLISLHICVSPLLCCINILCALALSVKVSPFEGFFIEKDRYFQCQHTGSGRTKSYMGGEFKSNSCRMLRYKVLTDVLVMEEMQFEGNISHVPSFSYRELWVSSCVKTANKFPF